MNNEFCEEIRGINNRSLKLFFVTHSVMRYRYLQKDQNLLNRAIFGF